MKVIVENILYKEMRGVIYEKEDETIFSRSVALLSLVVAQDVLNPNRHQNQQRKQIATSEVTTQVASNTKRMLIVQQHHLIGMQGCTTDKIRTKRMLNQIAEKPLR